MDDFGTGYSSLRLLKQSGAPQALWHGDDAATAEAELARIADEPRIVIEDEGIVFFGQLPETAILLQRDQEFLKSGTQLGGVRSERWRHILPIGNGAQNFDLARPLLERHQGIRHIQQGQFRFPFQQGRAPSR